MCIRDCPEAKSDPPEDWETRLDRIDREEQAKIDRAEKEHDVSADEDEPPELTGYGSHLLDTAALLLRAHRRMYP
jgi:hypothetical protein